MIGANRRDTGHLRCALPPASHTWNWRRSSNLARVVKEAVVYSNTSSFCHTSFSPEVSGVHRRRTAILIAHGGARPCTLPSMTLANNTPKKLSTGCAPLLPSARSRSDQWNNFVLTSSTSWYLLVALTFRSLSVNSASHTGLLPNNFANNFNDCQKRGWHFVATFPSPAKGWRWIKRKNRLEKQHGRLYGGSSSPRKF
jgi:hypothetical protein